MFYKIKLKKQLFKFLFSYLTIILITILGISISVYITLVSTLQTQIENSFLDKLKMLVYNYDEELVVLKKLSYNIFNDSKLSVYNLNVDEFTASKGYLKMKEYYLSNARLYDIILLDPDSSRVCTAVGIYSKDELFAQKYLFDQDFLKQLLDTLSSPGILTAYESKNTVLRTEDEPHKIITYSISDGNRLLLFLIKEDSYNYYAEKLLGASVGTVLVSDSNNRTIFTLNNGISPSIYNYIKSQDYNDVVLYMKIESQSYSAIKTSSDLSGWSFTVALPTSQCMFDVQYTKKLLSIMLFIFLCIGIILAFYFSIVYYKPFQALTNTIKKFSGDTSDSIKEDFNISNDIQFISKAIENAFNENYGLKDILQKHEPMIIKSALRELLLTKNPVSYSELSMDFFVNNFEKQCFVVLVAAFTLKNESGSMTPFSKIQKKLHDLKDTYCTDIYDNRLSIIINYNISDSYESKIITVEEIISQELSSYDNMDYFIGVGSSCNKLEDVYESYNDAVNAVQYGFYNKQEKIVNIINVKDSDFHLDWYQIEEEKKVFDCLRLGLKEECVDILNSICIKFSDDISSANLTRYVLYSIINIFIKVAYEYQLNEIDNNLLNHINRIANYKSVKTFNKEICDLCISFCELIQNSKSKELINEIIEYLYKNYSDSNLTLQSICDTFYISSSHITNIFKKETGFTLMKFLDLVRIKKAEELLIATNMNLDDIIYKVGYIDKVNFVRKFRIHFGNPPITYRKLNDKDFEEQN